MQSGKKTTLIVSIVIALIVIGAVIYLYLNQKTPSANPTTNNNPSTGFQPLNRPNTGTPNTNNNGQNNNNPTTTSSSTTSNATIPAIRLLSSTPIGGYGINTTATSTFVRWVDRGRGNVYETKNTTLEVLTISNTLVPRIYQSLWNKNLNAFIASTITDKVSESSTLYAGLKAYNQSRVSSSTESLEVTPFELKGKKLPENIITYAISPKKDKLFMLINESGKGVGYVSTFEGTGVTRIFETPATQFNAEWPEENTITLTTKGSFDQYGFLYFVNPKTGNWKKILGPVPGLSTKTSRDAKYVIASFAASEKTLSTVIYSLSTSNSSDPAIRTLSDKCVWGSFYKNIVYCGVPSQNIDATYPDDWYRGYIHPSDKLWQINASTGEVKILSSLSNDTNRIIDAFNLNIDDKDEYIYFMNKNDLSLWSLDLVSSN